MTLFYKLFSAFLIISLFPIIASSYLFMAPLENFLLDHVRSEASARLNKNAIYISNTIEHLDEVLKQSAHHIRFSEYDDKMLRWIFQSHPQMNELIAVNMEGIVQVAVSRFSYIAVGKKFKECSPSTFIKKDIRFSTWNNEPMITLHYPILSLSTNEQKGVLHAKISIASLFNALSRETDEHLEYIVNALNGHVIFHPDFNLVLNKSDASALNTVQQIVAGADFGYGEYKNFNGEEVFGAARSISNMPFILVEETTVEDAYLLLTKGKRIFYQILCASILFILIAAYFFSRSITKPVARLLAATMKIKQGDLDTTISREKSWLPDEISIFSDHFQSMVTALKRDRIERDNALQKERIAEEKLRKAEKMEAIGLLAGGVAHDLNNILSGIVSYPELLLHRLPEDSELRQPIETIKQSGERASEVVADLLTVARGVAASREIRCLNELISEYCTSPECREFHAAHKKVTCVQELAPDLLNVSCSPIHVQKCLMNLINNGIEAMDKSGTLLVSTRNQYIDQSTITHQDLEQGNYAIIHIEDTGGGISNLDLSHIFEPFYSKKVMGRSGTGLGLTVVWNTMQDHNGAVTVTSSEKGTIFELYFPATKQKEDSSANQEKIILPHGHGEKILVIDDVQEQRDIAGQILTQLGYQVHEVTSGEQAITYLQNNSVDLLLLDMIMEPGLTGRETYEKILAMHPNQKAVIASGFSESEDVKATLKLGAGGFIKKPYSMEQIGRAVNEVLHSLKVHRPA